MYLFLEIVVTYSSLLGLFSVVTVIFMGSDNILKFTCTDINLLRFSNVYLFSVCVAPCAYTSK